MDSPRESNAIEPGGFGHLTGKYFSSCGGQNRLVTPQYAHQLHQLKFNWIGCESPNREFVVESEKSLQVHAKKSQAREEGRTNGLPPTAKRPLSMSGKPEAIPIYQAASLFSERCLRHGMSLLWPRSHAWTVENLERLSAIFRRAPVAAGGGFFASWQVRLACESVDVHRIAADLVAFYYLFPSGCSATHKLESLKKVIGWKLANEMPALAFLDRAYASFIGATGPVYFAAIEEQMTFFILLAKASSTAKVNLDDVASMKLLAEEVMKQVKHSAPGRNVLLHLLFPHDVEGIVSNTHRKKIAEAFPQFTGEAGDVDEALHSIRGGLKAKFGSNFDFYCPEIRSLWDTDPPAGPAPKSPRRQRKPESSGKACSSARTPSVSGPRTWIFQAGRRFRDLASEARTGRNTTWRTRAFATQVRVNDSVYLWEAGPNGGIVGLAEVSDLSRTPSDRALELQLALPGMIDRPRRKPLMATLKIHESFEPVIQRRQLLRHPELTELSVFVWPRRSNHRVTPRQSAVLAAIAKGQTGQLQPVLTGSGKTVVLPRTQAA
jgi:EVE domain